MTLRKHFETPFVPFDFSRSYEIEALLHMGEETLAREEVQQMGEYLESNRRFRISYLRSLAGLASRDGQNEQAINHFRQAAQIAADTGLSAERWQIQVALARLYEAEGEPEQAHTASAEAASIIAELAEGIDDEGLRMRFVAATQIQQVMQHAQMEA